mmetsp:Transcript_50926/g.100092  ORF Transcript_50926/g.100092 Transcript_50926/m.100092 type:complete len:170 (-) Transcript_50926:908-1417(-)
MIEFRTNIFLFLIFFNLHGLHIRTIDAQKRQLEKAEKALLSIRKERMPGERLQEGASKREEGKRTAKERTHTIKIRTLADIITRTRQGTHQHEGISLQGRITLLGKRRGLTKQKERFQSRPTRDCSTHQAFLRCSLNSTQKRKTSHFDQQSIFCQPVGRVSSLFISFSF